MPVRGVHSIDALKRAARLEQMHVVGIDPGKRELVVAVDRAIRPGPRRYTFSGGARARASTPTSSNARARTR